MIAVTARLTAKPGKEAELETLLRGFVPQAAREPAVLAYALHRSKDRPGTFVFYERHATPATFQAHLAMPYLQNGLARMQDLLDGAPVLEVLDILEEIS